MQMTSKKSRDCDKETTTIAKSISDLVELRKQSVNNQTTKQLKYECMLANLDRMLSKLPEEVVEDLNMKFTNMAYEEVKKIQDL